MSCRCREMGESTYFCPNRTACDGEPEARLHYTKRAIEIALASAEAAGCVVEVTCASPGYKMKANVRLLPGRVAK